MLKGMLIALALTSALSARAAEPYIFYLGTELARSELEENKLTDDLLFGMSIEGPITGNLVYGVSGNAQDSERVGTNIRVDTTLSYRFLPGGTFRPYAGAGLAAVTGNRNDCHSIFFDIPSPHAQHGTCDADSFGSVGATAHVGAAIRWSRDSRLDFYLSHYVGTHDVRLSALGIRIGIEL